MINQSISRIITHLGVRGGVMAFACVALSGCRDSLNKLLAVQAPGRVIADSLNGPRYAALLVQSAVTDFECGFAAYVTAGGLFGDELADATVNAPNWPTDRRDPTVQESTISTNTCDRGSNPRFAIYTAMQIVRFEADDIARQELLELIPDSSCRSRPGAAFTINRT